MSEEKEVRNSVKLILLNENNELLLMSTDDKGIQGKEKRKIITEDFGKW